MKTATLALVASAAVLARGQATYNSSTGNFDCAQPNVAYCGGDSLQTDIIIRCDGNGVGQPGRCSDNLSGQPPIGNTPALCWEASADSGEAACEKNCVVYGGSGNYDGTFTLDSSLCEPTYTASSSASSTASSTASASYSTATSTSSSPGPWSTGAASSTATASGNGTASATSSKTSASASSTTSVVATAGAAMNSAGGLLATVGLIVAYFL